MTIISSLIRYGKRQLHTIVSAELIKPSFPTPSHIRTYNLSLTDQFVPSVFTAFITFYPKIDTYQSPHDQILDLKNSLSQTLTNYYPFAGRHARTAPTYVDCNDHGAEFVEASVDSTLSHFLQNFQYEDLYQFLPDGRVGTCSNPIDHALQCDTVIPIVIQVSRFECGGVAVAVSVSHKVADANSSFHFISDWAKMNRVCSKNEKCEVPSEPHFIPFEHTNYNAPEFPHEKSTDYVTKSFVFPNAKLNALKHKVTAMTARSEQHITNPTRVEVMVWLLYKSLVAAATETNSGSFTPSSILVPVNIRDKFMEPLPEKCIGNFVFGLLGRTRSEAELKPELLIGELRKQKMQIQGIKNLEAFYSYFSNISSFNSEERETTNNYLSTSLCGYPTYGIDFGWGTPIKATAPGVLSKNGFLLMDGPNKSVEALVSLGKQDMDVIQRDPELLAFC